MRAVYERIERLAPFPIPVLIQGESGTGKELAGRAMWQISARDRPFVAVGCAAIDSGVIESELFGHVRGAFTGAVRDHRGILREADGGVLFLDEVGELSPQAQAKLLRALETGEYRPVGGDRTRRAEFRLIAATHRDLREMVRRGRFREDLLYRLGAARIVMPPLRDRLEDLPILATAFLQACACRNGRRLRLSDQALELLREAEWPGNVRQLRNVIEASAALALGQIIGPKEVRACLETRCPPSPRGARAPTLADAVASAEAEAITDALARADGDRREAARLLGISLTSLYRKLDRMERPSRA